MHRYSYNQYGHKSKVDLWIENAILINVVLFRSVSMFEFILLVYLALFLVTEGLQSKLLLYYSRTHQIFQSQLFCILQLQPIAVPI